MWKGYPNNTYKYHIDTAQPFNPSIHQIKHPVSAGLDPPWPCLVHMCSIPSACPYLFWALCVHIWLTWRERGFKVLLSSLEWCQIVCIPKAMTPLSLRYLGRSKSTFYYALNSKPIWLLLTKFVMLVVNWLGNKGNVQSVHELGMYIQWTTRSVKGISEDVMLLS